MDDATQKLVDEARRYAKFDGEFGFFRVKPLLVEMADALEAARAEVDAYERDAVERSEQGRTDYDYEQKIAALEAAQRPPVSPEVREGIEAEVMWVLKPAVEDALIRPLARRLADALLARFSFPTLDVEKALLLVHDLADHGIRFDLNPTVDGRSLAASYVSYIGRIDRSIRERAAAALPTLTKEGVRERAQNPTTGSYTVRLPKNLDGTYKTSDSERGTT